ncbi:hypothetical protein MED222_05075 [Vibrio sp. MED222]|nr:hypothetical protein MED222_05075 [Vibrio sp. MED222]
MRTCPTKGVSFRVYSVFISNRRKQCSI